jgi:hypothetical protein
VTSGGTFQNTVMNLRVKRRRRRRRRRGGFAA